jgi:hypothetical protein
LSNPETEHGRSTRGRGGAWGQNLIGEMQRVLEMGSAGGLVTDCVLKEP